MSNCEHLGQWHTYKSTLMPNLIGVRCADCGIESNFAMALVESGFVTGNVIRKSWGQSKDFVPTIPDTVEELLAKIVGEQS